MQKSKEKEEKTIEYINYPVKLGVLKLSLTQKLIISLIYGLPLTLFAKKKKTAENLGIKDTKSLDKIFRELKKLNLIEDTAFNGNKALRLREEFKAALVEFLYSERLSIENYEYLNNMDDIKSMLKSDSSTLNETSPDVTPTSPDVAETSPDVELTSPDVEEFEKRMEKFRMDIRNKDYPSNI